MAPPRKKTVQKSASKLPPTKVKDNVLGKRKSNNNDGPVSKKPNTPKATTAVNSRSSKRARMTAIPYQTPESISTVLQAFSQANDNRVSAAAASNNTPTTPKLPVTKKSLKTPKTSVTKLTPTNLKSLKNNKKSTPKTSSTATLTKRKDLQLVKKKLILGEDEKSKKTTKVSKDKKKQETSTPTTIIAKAGKKSKVKVIPDPDESDAASTSTTKSNTKKKSKKEALNPKPHVTLYDKDPTFRSNLPIPHISTLAHSRLLIRAVLLQDNKLLKQLITKDISLISGMCHPQAPALHTANAFNYAVAMGNHEATKMFVNEGTKAWEKLGPPPDLLIQPDSTGSNNTMMFGHAMRAVTVARGGKEGNAALLKDSNLYSQHSTGIPHLPDHGYLGQALESGVPYSTFEFLSTLAKDSEPYFWRSLLENITVAVRYGHTEIAGKLVTAAIKRGGYGFNHLHEQSLTLSKSKPFSDFKAQSVVKKSTSNFRITPLHCAAINPNPYYLQTLLISRPEYSIIDQGNWMPIHYAAVCTSDGPLKLLLSRGVATNVVDKDIGNTPLHLAVSRGRFHNVKVLVEHEMKQKDDSTIDDDDEEDGQHKKPKKVQSDNSLERVNKHGKRPLQLAAEGGHVDILKYLLKVGADADKCSPAQNDKLTPLMNACEHGHLDIVKVLVDHGAKLALLDRRGRTAIFHAVLNGHAHIVSYLLRLGVNQHATDSSGNTLAHYAAAYGWYFNVKLLIEAECDVAKTNDWKMNPLGIAWMKGHIGIVELLLKQSGVDINTPVDGDTGMSLLIVTCSSSTWTCSLSPRLKFLIDDLKADCKIADLKGNNALHYIAGYHISEEEHEFELHRKHQIEAVKFLSDRGCDSSAVNSDNKSPFMIACEAKNFHIAEKFIDWGFKLKLDVDSATGDTILHKIARHADHIRAKPIWEKLAKLDSTVLAEMAKIFNNEGFTPLLQVLTTHSKVTAPEAERVANFLEYLVKKLDSDVNATVIVKSKSSATTKSKSALHLVAMSLSPDNFYKILRTKRLDLDPLDENLRTPLTTSILTGQPGLEISSSLIKDGANVNFQSKQDWSLSVMLLLGEKQPSMFRLIPEMVQRGANIKEINSKTKNSILHCIAKNPKQPFALEAIKAVVVAGADVNLKNKDGRTALHLVVNARANETDVAYDIEDFLLSSGADLGIKDMRGRSPLHYVFVKIGKPLEKSFLDPIELVMILMDSIKTPTKPATFIKMADAFGSTPLHCAAMRGATICCSYFTEELQGNIDIIDLRGNTPFGLAVWSGHEGCSLHFQQQGANFLHLLDTNIKLLRDSKESSFENDTESSTKPFFENSQQQSSEEQESSTSFRLPSMWKKRQSYIFGQFDSSGRSSGNTSPSLENENTKSSSPEAGIMIWEHEKLQNEELRIKRTEQMKYPIFQEVVIKEWQGILHLMLAKLRSAGANLGVAISTAIKTQKLRLALKLIHRVKEIEELRQKDETLLHTLAKYSPSKSAPDDTFNSDVINDLLEKGVNPTELDVHSSNPVIYAAINLNLEMIKQLSNCKSNDIARMPQDKLGRTPFSALFWNINEFTEFPSDVATWALSLLSYGASPNILSKYPFILSPFPGVTCLVKCNSNNSNYNYNEFPKYSPLIVAVIHKRYQIVSWLLRPAANKVTADVNFQDELGRTPMMHAVRLNDIRMVKLLLNPTSYKPDFVDIALWTTDYSKTKGKLSTTVDLNVRDKKGWTASDYVVCPSVDQKNNYSFAHVQQVLAILHSAGASPFTLKSGDGLSPLERAIQLKRFHVVRAMYNISNTPSTSQISCDLCYDDPLKIISQDIGQQTRIQSFSEDAEKAAQEKLSKIKAELLIKPDPLLELDEDNAEVVIDPEQNIPLDCILTHVDLDYGIRGLYNFYKMQVVKQPRGKELVLLFTQWGRVGTQGQYQRTPFPKEEEAVKEFKKIFKSKSGNNWENLATFQPIPKKYRLVHKELTKAKSPSELKVDFDKLVGNAKSNKSTLLPSSVYSLMELLTLTHKMELGASDDDDNHYYSHFRQTNLKVSGNLPVISLESLKKADAILNQIHPLLVKKYKMHYGNLPNANEEDKLGVLTQLVTLSEEYYTLVPVYGFASETLQPIFDFSDLKNRQEEIYKLIHLGFAKELILAAELNSSLNPFEYIYRCLGTKIRALDMQGQEKVEGQMILQYINNTAPKTRIQNIFRIQSLEQPEMQIGNRWMLWHGTKPENTLSILHDGLRISPLGVAKMGDLFGKGIYFADSFDKSQGYTSSYTASGSTRFMFLCEVALGKIQEVRLYDNPAADDPSAEKALSKGFDSSKTSDAEEIPDPAGTILRNGIHIPLGKMIEQVFPKDQSSGLTYNEYIIFNEKQVHLRYLVQFSDN